jgi:hypothetical protein
MRLIRNIKEGIATGKAKQHRAGFSTPEAEERKVSSVSHQVYSAGCSYLSQNSAIGWEFESE